MIFNPLIKRKSVKNDLQKTCCSALHQTWMIGLLSGQFQYVQENAQMVSKQVIHILPNHCNNVN